VKMWFLDVFGRFIQRCQSDIHIHLESGTTGTTLFLEVSSTYCRHIQTYMNIEFCCGFAVCAPVLFT